MPTVDPAGAVEKPLRSLFDPEIVAVVQNDAIERKGLKQLLLEPELLDIPFGDTPL